MSSDEPAAPEGREPASATEQPTVMQIIELSDEIEAAGLGQVDFARAVLARWGRPTPQPVPVSERLPGDQLCWWYEPDEDDDGTGYGGNWTLLRIRGCVSYYTHWLPAHVLPLPTAND